MFRPHIQSQRLRVLQGQVLLSGAALLACGCLKDGRPLQEYQRQYDQWDASRTEAEADVAPVLDMAPQCSDPTDTGVVLIVDNLREDPVAAFEVTEACELVRRPEPIPLRTEYETFVGVVWRFTDPDDQSVVYTEYRLNEDARQRILVQ